MSDLADGPPVLSAVSGSARQLFILLRCIGFAQKVRVQITEDGLRFSAEDNRVMQGMRRVSVVSSASDFVQVSPSWTRLCSPPFCTIHPDPVRNLTPTEMATMFQHSPFLFHRSSRRCRFLVSQTQTSGTRMRRLAREKAQMHSTTGCLG